MNQQWVEGDFIGTYVGERIDASPAVRSAAGSRRFTFELRSGRVGALSIVPPPTRDAASARQEGEVWQAKLDEVSLSTGAPGFRDRETRPLYDVRVRDFHLSHPAESGGRSYGTIQGTICARLSPDVVPAAVLPDDKKPPAPSRVERRDESTSVGEARSRSETPPLDAEEVYARVRWIAAFILFSLVALALHLRCGATSAGTWAIPVVLALVARRALRGVAIHTYDLGFWVGSGLVAFQIYWLMAPAELAWQYGCKADLQQSLLALAAPVVLSAALRSRWVMVLTAVLWTGTMFHWCAEVAGTCSPQAIAASEAAASSRTDTDGKWPAPPSNAAIPGGIDGSARSVDAARDVSPVSKMPAMESQQRSSLETPNETIGGRIGDWVVEGTVRSSGSGSGDLFAADSPSVAWAQDSLPDNSSEPEGALPTRAGIGPSFGERPDELVLISVDYANRNPGAFYESPIGRRIYLQSDPIFETGSARIRKRAGSSLTRLASLMNLRPGRRIALEVHTDASSGAELQKKLSSQRATALGDWLVEHGGVDRAQFEVLAVGTSRPLVPPHGGPPAQGPNRRIEARLLN